ncbi:pseudaminic acid cytidylyltransferase [Neptunicella sp. SCSIO 80796]|uniref:pseudaminic acid cytidylyltransferase n=1 Tax=Neptunicella plasticusilytica TaxID=3117012 RepID=UPI003A4DCB61
MNLAVIPARGGSKRIPGKNIREFAGKPLIAYSIEVAMRSGLFEKVIVSTDSQNIADVALQYGADVPFIRPVELADDYTGTRPVTNHAIEYCRQHFFEPQLCCCIYATAPFLQVDSLLEGYQELHRQQDKAFAFSVTSYAFPIQRSLRKINNGVEPVFPDNIAKRSQDLEETYHDAGQFYWGRSNDYLSSKKIFSDHSIPVVLPRHLVQDIDTEEDWLRAELMYQAYMRDHN